MGRYIQFGVGAVIPVNQASGDYIGVQLQLHFYVDDIFPHSGHADLWRKLTNMRSLLAVLVMTVFTSPAIAHAFLQHASPGAGATLAVAPKEVVLEFSEPIEAVFSGAEVTDAAGRSIEMAPVAISGNTIRIALKTLAPGRYRVRWHAVSVDTHRTDGAYDITIKP